MRSRMTLAGMLLAATIPVGLAASAAAAPPVPREAFQVTLDSSRLSTVVGDRFTLRSHVRNSGTAPSERFLAHLNVASLSSDVYVDPEDWSSRRTLPVAPLGRGSDASLSWELQAVNAGSFDVYVVLLPDGASSAGTGPLFVSPPLHVTVAERRPLNAGGSLPVVVVVPVLLGVAAAAALYRVRRGG